MSEATGDATADPLNASAPGAPASRPIPDSVEQADRIVRVGYAVLLAGLLPMAAWLCFAPLRTAVVAPAVVKVDLNRRPVQHLEGGTVREVLVRDGQRVKTGDPILVLGDVVVDADRERLRYRVLLERATVARLQAEQALSALSFPREVQEAAKHDPRIKSVTVKEQALFESRRKTLVSQVALLKQQRGKIQQEISTVGAQIRQAQASLAAQTKELDSNRGLEREGFISPIRIARLEAGVSDYASKLEERRAERVRAEQRMMEVDLKIQSLHNDYSKVASDELKVSNARLAEYEQEHRKSEDAAQRQAVVAPSDGVIIDLKFNSPGSVVSPRETIAEIVPGDEKLVIESRVRPEDFNHLAVGQEASIRFTGFKYQSAMMVQGRITYISADRLTDKPTGVAYYAVLVEVDRNSLERAGEVKLHAGMPGEVYLQGKRLTPIQYLIEPITTTLRRSAREL